MKTITFKAWAHCKPVENWCEGHSNVIDAFQYVTLGFEPTNSCGQATVTIEVADDFDPRISAVEMLKQRKQKAMADFQKLVNEIDAQISRYTAIECGVTSE